MEIEYFERKSRKQWGRYVLLSGNRRSRVEEKNLNLLNHLLERDELQDRLAMEESISNRRFQPTSRWKTYV